MKKLLLLLMTGSALGAAAQITINSANVVNVNDTAFVSNDTTGSFTTGPSGANQSWNFSSLVEDYADTMIFMPPLGLPAADSFPTATMVIQDVDTEWIYLEKNSAAVNILGIVQVTPVDTQAYDFNTPFITFPSTYNTSFSATVSPYTFDTAIAMDPDGPGPHPFVDSIRIKASTTTNSIMDGWGDVTTPLGTFPSIRQNVIQIEDDSTFMYANGQWQLISPLLETMFNTQATTHDTTSREVRWWTDDPVYRFNILTFEYDSVGNSFGGVEWLKAAPVGILEYFAQKKTSVYPNPASDVITVTAKGGNALYRIFNVQGALVTEGRFTGQMKLDVSGFEKGLYLLQITRDNQVDNLKIDVQ